jgi:hypothetical protein
MKAKGITGKGCYKEYYYAPKWFIKGFGGDDRCALLNVLGSKHYLGYGFDKRKRTWDSGVFLTDFAMSLDFWAREAAEADFIIHFREAL